MYRSIISVFLCKPNLSLIFLRWLSTVWREIHSLSAISFSDEPLANNFTTLNSASLKYDVFTSLTGFFIYIYIMLIAVLFNHLGLAEIITFHSKKNVVLNCSKCLTFWTTLGYSLFITGQGVIPSLFYSFTLAYLALWVELLLNVFNYYYTKSYGKIYQAEDDTTSSSESDKLP